jgi:NAD(P)-dependent dehydrogenase (short-subunit alcohol dehydrogenase family)
MGGLDGKVAVVTGASRGIGKETALELARQGADVVVAARTVERRKVLPGTIHETVEAVEAVGRRAVAVATDVSKAEDCDALIARAVDELGRIDILVNNAAYTSGRALNLSVWELSREDWELQFATNVHGPFSLIKAAAPHMRRHGGGAVVNVTSIASEMQPVSTGSGAFAWTYGSSKAALNRMSNGLAAQLLDDGITVVAIHPGVVRTELLEILSDRGGPLADAAIPTSVPAKVIAYMSSPEHARPYSGQVLMAETMYEELGLS